MGTSDEELLALARDLGQALVSKNWHIATAESCTGGGLGQIITAVAGSSHWFDRGWVTYSDAAKLELLGADADLLEQHGAVSDPVARAMAEGALARSQAQIAVSVTGIAGPGGGTADKPVGTVHYAWAVQQRETLTAHCTYSGNRAENRRRAVATALRGALELVQSIDL